MSKLIDLGAPINLLLKFLSLFFQSKLSSGSTGRNTGRNTKEKKITLWS
jgi:hypothetical protein